jgi:hypothetical protein
MISKTKKITVFFSIFVRIEEEDMSKNYLCSKLSENNILFLLISSMNADDMLFK